VRGVARRNYCGPNGARIADASRHERELSGNNNFNEEGNRKKQGR